MSSVNTGGNGKGPDAAAAGGGGGLGSIPAASRKVVLSLKEIVNCPEAEIYATLRECNMDPNEAVNRLLTQDPFHEVKSKREKKKENKDITEFRPRGTGLTSNRGGRSGTDRRSGSTQYNYSESGNLHERPAYRKENGTHSHGTPYSSTLVTAHTDWPASSFSDNIPKESKFTTTSKGDGISSTLQPPTGFQSAWGGEGTVGHVSMADIVKKGRPQNKAPGPVNPPYYIYNHAAPGSESEVRANQHPVKDEWPEIEHRSASTFSSIQATEDIGKSSLYFDSSNQNIKSDDIPCINEGTIENINENHVGIAPATVRSLDEHNAGDASYYDNNAYEDPSPYQQYEHGYEHEYEHEEAEDGSAAVSSMAANLQELNLEKDKQVQSPKEETRSVVIPGHLQVQSAECLNLSFGSFGAVAGGLSGISAPVPLNNDVEEQSEEEDASPVVHSDFRNSEHYRDEQVRDTSAEDLINRSAVSSETHTSVSAPQLEVLKQDIPSEPEGAQYAFHNSLPGYNFEDNHQQQLNATYAQSQSSSQTQNPAPLSNVMAYANLSPASLLASSVQQPVRESDMYSQFHANPSMTMKYGNPGNLVGGSSASAAEALEASNISSSQQGLPSASATGGLPQHLAMHPYSQPALPLGPFPNMISYPFMPHQNYTYMPNAFQQAFGGNSSYHQSLAAVLPQYKNNLSVSSLPQSGAVPSGYGAFGGSSTSVPGNFSLNQTAAPGGSSGSYEDIMNSQNKEHLLTLQQAQLQNENSAMYGHGNGTRTMSGAPANTYYNFQGQNQQPGGFRQSQQLQPQQQHFGSLGYPNFYHSQSGMSMEHQQQNPRDGSLGGSQVQPSKQTQQHQQMWQNSY